MKATRTAADRPILFSAPMIQALWDLRKAQTRRTLTRLAGFGNIREFGRSDTGGYDWHFRDKCLRWHDLRDAELRRILPYMPGDRLWIKESTTRFDKGTCDQHVWYRAGRNMTGDAANDAWLRRSYPDLTGNEEWPYTEGPAGGAPYNVSSIHMPRWASRLTLLVSAVRVERLADISREDALAEGVEMESADPPFYYVPGIWPHSLTGVGIEEPGGRHAERSFAKLWNHVNGQGAWEANPWVVVVTFEVLRANIRDLAPRA